MLPAPSVARTWNVCELFARALYACGSAHAANAPPSRLQAKARLVSVDVKLKLAVVLAVNAKGSQGNRRLRRRHIERVYRPTVTRGCGVEVAGRVDRADLEDVRANGQSGIISGVAQLKRRAVEAAGKGRRLADVILNAALVLVAVAGGLAVIVVSGGTTSMVQ